MSFNLFRCVSESKWVSYDSGLSGLLYTQSAEGFLTDFIELLSVTIPQSFVAPERFSNNDQLVIQNASCLPNLNKKLKYFSPVTVIIQFNATQHKIECFQGCNSLIFSDMLKWRYIDLAGPRDERVTYDLFLQYSCRAGSLTRKLRWHHISQALSYLAALQIRCCPDRVWTSACSYVKSYLRHLSPH